MISEVIEEKLWKNHKLIIFITRSKQKSDVKHVFISAHGAYDIDKKPFPIDQSLSHFRTFNSKNIMTMYINDPLLFDTEFVKNSKARPTSFFLGASSYDFSSLIINKLKEKLLEFTNLSSVVVLGASSSSLAMLHLGSMLNAHVIIINPILYLKKIHFGRIKFLIENLWDDNREKFFKYNNELLENSSSFQSLKIVSNNLDYRYLYDQTFNFYNSFLQKLEINSATPIYNKKQLNFMSNITLDVQTFSQENHGRPTFHTISKHVSSIFSDSVNSANNLLDASRRSESLEQIISDDRDVKKLIKQTDEIWN